MGGCSYLQPLHQDNPVQKNESPQPIVQEDHEDNDDNSDRDEGHESEAGKSSDEEEDNKSDSEKEESDHDNNNKDDESRRSSSASTKKSESSKEGDEEQEQEQEREKEIVQEVVLDEIEDNLSYEEKVKKALTGDMDFHYPEKVKIVRIFTSSTFTGKLWALHSLFPWQESMKGNRRGIPHIIL